MRLLLCYCLNAFLYLFMVQKLYSFLLLGTGEIWVIYIGTCRAFEYCVNLCHICSIIAGSLGLKCSTVVPYCP